MDLEYFRTYCLSKKGVEECFPFDETTLVFKAMGKMFALAGLDNFPATANLKCDPERAILLREEYESDVKPGYHMNKTHWNTVSLEGELTEQMIKDLIDHSYDLIINSLPKKLKQEWELL